MLPFPDLCVELLLLVQLHQAAAIGEETDLLPQDDLFSYGLLPALLNETAQYLATLNRVFLILALPLAAMLFHA